MILISILAGLISLNSSSGKGDAKASTPYKKEYMASVCDYLAHSTWGPWRNFKPLEKLHENGMEWCRAWVLTTSLPELNVPYEKWRYLTWKDETWSCREYTAQILKEAAKNGMRLDLVLFLSDRAAHAGWQYAPKGWENCSVEETASALETSCYEIAYYFKSQGLEIEIYEMGNEIESGICGFFPGLPGGRIPYPSGIDKFSPEGVLWWKENIWNIEATLLKSAIKGVKRVNPSAKILLHTDSVNAHPNLGGSVWSEKNLFPIGFFQSMVEYGVEFDYVGLSYYPSSNFIPTKNFAPIFDELQDVIDSIATITRKKIFISEFSYSGNRPGVYYERPNYPFTEEGQARCIADFLQWITNNIHVQGVAYWYPDRFPGMSQEAPNEDSLGLFASETEIRPALLEFKKTFYPPLYPPSNFKLQRLENNMIFYKEYINSLSWEANPNNITNIMKYKLYRKAKASPDKDFQLISELNSSAISYVERGLKKADLYSYWITAVDEFGRESKPALASN